MSDLAHDVVTTAASDADAPLGPVAETSRRLRGVDLLVLWGDLSEGILVLAAGALLIVPVASGGLGLSLGKALVATAMGSVVGAVLLALVSVCAHDRGVPSMVLLRSVLGSRGSCLASAVNFAQLVGWTAFEYWAMSLFASRVSSRVFGFSAFHVWIVVFALGCTALALAGPRLVTQVWLERAGFWITLATCGYLTVYLIARGHVAHPHGRSAPFGVAVDLVVSMPVSWLPLVADYNRFAISRRRSFTGTLTGYGVGNFWFYALGALLVLSGGLTDPSPAGIAAAVLGLSATAVVGLVLLVALLAVETDGAFADLYSGAVSLRNIFPRLPQRGVVVVISAGTAVLAAVVTVGNYQTFLLWLGSVFVPLFAVVLADWATAGFRGAATGSRAAWRPANLLAWVLGTATYQWIVPTGPTWWVNWVTREVPGAGAHSWLGASLPSFALAFAVTVVLQVAARLTRARSRPEDGVKRGRGEERELRRA